MLSNSSFRRLPLLILVVLISCSTPVSLARTNNFRKNSGREKVYAIRNVNVIPMTPGGEALHNATVIVQNERIISLKGPVPAHAVIIDGKGKWLIPGLIDMHVHIPTDGHFNTDYPTRAAAIFTNTQDIMTPFVANGVTTVFELNAVAGHFGQKNEILRGDVIGPRMALAALMNGGEESGRIASTAADGRQAVRLARAEGYEYVKVYSQLNIKTFRAIVDEAGKLGMKIVGHIPNAFRGRVEEAFVPHFGMVAHAEEFAKLTKDFSDNDAKRFALLCKDNDTWLCPTLTIIERSADQARSLDSVRNLQGFQYVHPLLQDKWLTANNNYRGTSPQRVARLERIAAFNRQLVKTFKETGVPIVAGTDAGCSGVVWGFSLQDEIELLVEAGLTPGEALTAATRLPATWLGLDSLVGTVEVGKFADLVLLDHNPLISIKNTRQISGVFVNGQWLDKAHIVKMLADLSKRNTALKHKYQWSKRTKY
jgi:imidazolonepropionase-like amidohydrolase